MACVNGCQHSECEDLAHDSNSNLLGPHGSERQETTSTVGAGGGGTAACGSKRSTIYQTPLISIPPGTQDGESQSTVPRSHRTHYKPVPEIQSLKFIVSPLLFHTIIHAIPNHHLLYCSEVEVIHNGDNNKCIVSVFVQ